MRLKYLLVLALTFSASKAIFAQRLYVNLTGGIMNYGGDLQEHFLTFKQAHAALGLGLSYRLANHFSVSASYVNGKVSASDRLTNTRNYTRNLSFYSNISEGSLTVEASLKDVPGNSKFTPYITTGISFYHFNPYTYDTLSKKIYLQPLGTEGQGTIQYPERKMYNLTQLAIPFGVGIQYALSSQVIISAEISYRKLFTDYLDDVSTTYADTAILAFARGPVSSDISFRGDELKPPTRFETGGTRGNPKHNDVFYTALIRLSFSFGNSDRSSNNGYSKKIRKQSGCPGKVL